MAPRGYPASVRALAVQLYQDGLTSYEIGHHLGVSTGSVHNWLRGAGIPPRRKGPRGRREREAVTRA